MRSMANQTIPGGGPGMKGNNESRLIAALENYILPLAQANSVHEADGIAPESGLSLEATNLLVALQKFVVSLAARNLPLETTVLDPPRTRLAESISNHVTFVTAPRPPLLELILEKTRHRVFNQMPIRMLAFDSHGTGIRLLERPEVLRIISQKMEEDFSASDVSKINPDDLPDVHADHLIESFLDRHCAYAILSHTWLRELPGEVTFTDWMTNAFDLQSDGYRKLEMFCRVSALNHGMTLGWMDTCCINKTSSVELDESIRSMFRWYKSSAVCITYLADTMTLEDTHKDVWFTRGWTLQELVAPRMTKFYRKDWECLISSDTKLDDKHDEEILEEICEATTITRAEIRSPMKATNISRRMQWAAKRNVTKEEDAAYSLMGIFDVSFSTAYGEGSEAAFVRLIREILNENQKDTGTLDIVNWGHGYNSQQVYSRVSMLVPVSPKCYADSVPDISWPHLYEPVLFTPLGLRVTLLVMPALRANPAQAGKCTPRGEYYAIANVVGHFTADTLPRSKTANQESSEQYGVYNVLDNTLFDAEGKLLFTRPWVESEDSRIQLFGVLNFMETKTTVHLPSIDDCFAIMLLTDADVGARRDTPTLWPARMASPVTYHLQPYGDTNVLNYKILKHDLHKHGITLTTMYL